MSKKIVFLLLILCTQAVAAEKLPCTARILDDEAILYSSPGEERYETLRLKKGDVIEVYQINENGWCAIRPPVGSFSWVSGEYLDVGLNNIGIVTVDQLASRIGTQQGDQCKTVQVLLKKGEKVVLLERVETPENTASPVWYKIVPPSGEFRWISRTAFETVPSPRNAITARGAPTSYNTPRNVAKNSIRQVAFQSEGIPGGPLPNQPFGETVIEENNANVMEPMHGTEFVVDPGTGFPAGFPSDFPAGFPAGFPAAQSGASQGAIYNPRIANQHITNQRIAMRDNGPASYSPSSSLISSPISSAVSPGFAPNANPTPDPYQLALAQFHREVHNVLNRPTEDWVFEALIKKGKELHSLATTEADRTRVFQWVQTLEKTWSIRRYNTMRRQQASWKSGGKMTHSALQPTISNLPAGPNGAVNGTINGAANGSLNGSLNGTVNGTTNGIQNGMLNGTINQVSATTTGVATPNGTPVANAFSAPTGLQGVPNLALPALPIRGKLGWYRQRPEGYPPFAVVNEQNEILALVSPDPGVELGKYSGQTVELNGRIGVYRNASGDVPHVQARSVFPVSWGSRE